MGRAVRDVYYGPSVTLDEMEKALVQPSGRPLAITPGDDAYSAEFSLGIRPARS
jgi:hypothetical protein